MQQQSPPDFSSMLRLDGKVFVVLGAGQGIGEQTCHALAQNGARVVCVDRDPALAEAIAASVGGVACAANVTDRADMVRVFDTAQQQGRFAGVVDIVGIARLGAIANFDDAGWAEQFDIILRHVFLTIQLAAPLLAANGGGSLTFVGSLSGLRSFKQQAAYGSAKAALHHLVRTAAVEYGPAGVRINAAAPGFIRTPRLNQRLDETQWQIVGRATPIGRAASPAEIAATLLFLSSPLASHVTGQVLAVDGGLSCVAAMPDIQFAPPKT